MNHKNLLTLAIVLIMVGSVVSYFVRPRPPLLELVTPKQELSTYQAQYPGAMDLANRVVKSYELAMILVQGPYVSTNITALEGVRQWAHERFQNQPDFLHPVSLPMPVENRDTVFGAMGYSLFAGPRYFAEEHLGHLLSARIAAFHNSRAYHSFHEAYFDFFGKDADAASLLARYESERAKSAIHVLLWALVWLAGAVASVAVLIKNARKDFFSALQTVTAYTWLLLASTYLAQTWVTGHASGLIAAGLALSIAGYLFLPVSLTLYAEARPTLTKIRLAPCWIAVAAWFTLSCLCVQLLTWMRTVPVGFDPVSLFLSSLSGNFLHDPVAGKRFLASTIAVVWTAATIWVVRQRHKTEPYSPEFEAHFETLNRAVSLERILSRD